MSNFSCFTYSHCRKLFKEYFPCKQIKKYLVLKFTTVHEDNTSSKLPLHEISQLRTQLWCKKCYLSMLTDYGTGHSFRQLISQNETDMQATCDSTHSMIGCHQTGYNQMSFELTPTPPKKTGTYRQCYLKLSCGL